MRFQVALAAQQQQQPGGQHTRHQQPHLHHIRLCRFILSGPRSRQTIDNFSQNVTIPLRNNMLLYFTACSRISVRKLNSEGSCKKFAKFKNIISVVPLIQLRWPDPGDGHPGDGAVPLPPAAPLLPAVPRALQHLHPPPPIHKPGTPFFLWIFQIRKRLRF